MGNRNSQDITALGSTAFSLLDEQLTSAREEQYKARYSDQGWNKQASKL